MTSLSKQLDSLRTATARQLTVEKKHVSLLFERQEAEKLDRETIHKIGCTGFAQIKKLDSSTFEDCAEFFDEAVLNFQRTMITKEENEKLNKKLEKFIFKLGPYLMHFSCQQVLEWLVHKYQIHAFNGELLITTFLPFHDTNVFGRLLSIIELDFRSSKDWAFLEEFGKKRIPVPFRIVLKRSLSSNHSLLSRVSDHIENGVNIVGTDFLETKSSFLFTFFAKLVLSVLENAKSLDDNLISKIIPIVGNGLRSSIASFRNSSMMIVCQLCLSVKLSAPIISSITKILLIKIKPTTVLSSLSTLVVICQQQTVEAFSKKAILKLLRKADLLEVWATIGSLSSQTDLLPFLELLWSSLCSIALEEDTADDVRQEAFNGLQRTAVAEKLSKLQAQAFISQIISSYAVGLTLPTSMKSDIYNICLRFADEFEEIVVEWTSRDKDTLEKFMSEFNLDNLVAVSTQKLKKRQRKRSNSIRKSLSELEEQKKTATERAQSMAQSSEFAKRQKFSGDPMKKAIEWIAVADINNLSWALEEMCLRKSYISHQLDEEVEEFVVRLIKFYQKQKGITLDTIKAALSNATLRADFLVTLFRRHELAGSSTKKAKGKGEVTVEKAFEDETDADYWKRIIFVAETLTLANTISMNNKLFTILFDNLKESEVIQDGQLQHSVQHSLISLLIKMVSSPGNYKLTTKDLQLDPIVETMRSTKSHHILRDSLRLLTAAVQLNPSAVTSHIMSVFTFMGSGLLRKDNDLTLGIIERTLEALFSAILNKQQISKTDVALKLVSVSRVFSASAPDIPAHRRGGMARAISRAVGVEGIWIVACVMLEGFCTKWQRNDPNKKSAEQDAFEDIAQELCTELSAPEQLKVVLDLVQFVVRLGGDETTSKKSELVDVAVFDRSKFTVQKLRHFRFVIIGITMKILSSRVLLEKLAAKDDEDLYKAMLPIGKRLMMASVDLDEFGAKEAEAAEKSGDPQTLRYWIAVQGRSETIAEKLRHLLPGGVAAKLISDVLEDNNTKSRMREKILQLANVKLLTDGFFYSNSGINEEHLSRLAAVLNKWIVSVRSDFEKIELCKNATFSLKLVARRIPKQSESAVLTETMEKCVALLNQWQTLDETMVGNVLFLAGELIRSHNMRCTMLSCEPLLEICLTIIGDYLSASHQNKMDEESSQTKRQRVRQQSLSGRRLGSDTLLIAALTCLQRILDQFSAFVSSRMGEIFVRFCRVIGRFSTPETNPIPPKGTVQHRIALIRLALSNMEFRALPAHFAFAVKELVSEEKPLCALMALLGSYFVQKNRSIVSPHRLSLLNDIFIPALEFRNIERKPENFENVTKVEKCIASTLLKMSDTLNESELRSVFSGLVQWAVTALDGEQSRSTRIRLIPLFHFANEFYVYFNHLAMPYFGKLMEIAPTVLKRCNASQVSDSSNLILHGKRETVEGLETDFLLRQVIIFVGNCGRHKEFISRDSVEAIAMALTEELSNTRVAGHESRCVPHLAEALYRICDASPESFPDILNKIMLKSRNNSPKIRFRTLLVIEALLDRIGDGIAPHLPVIMPFLSELLEDENKTVEDQCDRVIRLLQKKFGEGISEGFA